MSEFDSNVPDAARSAFRTTLHRERGKRRAAGFMIGSVAFAGEGDALICVDECTPKNPPRLRFPRYMVTIGAIGDFGKENIEGAVITHVTPNHTLDGWSKYSLPLPYALPWSKIARAQGLYREVALSAKYKYGEMASPALHGIASEYYKLYERGGLLYDLGEQPYREELCEGMSPHMASALGPAQDNLASTLEEVAAQLRRSPEAILDAWPLSEGPLFRKGKPSYDGVRLEWTTDFSGATLAGLGVQPIDPQPWFRPNARS